MKTMISESLKSLSQKSDISEEDLEIVDTCKMSAFYDGNNEVNR